MFSAVLIVKNEEKCLDACLKSIKNYKLITEIIIVDTWSIDKTKEIAKKYTNKIYNFKWCDDFSKARNFAKSKASNKWILSIDADEILESFFDEVPKEKTDGYYVKLTNDTETATNACRIFKKELNWKWKIHEYIQPKNWLSTDVTIRFWRSPAHDLDPMRNLRILAQVYKENPTDQRNLYYLWRETYNIWQYEPAIQALKEYIALPNQFHNPELIDAYFLLSLCYYKLNKISECKSIISQVIVRNPFFKNAYYLLEITTKDRRMKEKWKQLKEQATDEWVLLKINLDNLLYKV